MPRICASCGAEHVDTPDSCRHCGFDRLTDERVEALESRPYTTERRWECRSCGRLHIKSKTICSRCGSGPLDRTTIRFYDVEQTRSRIAGLRPYLPGVAAIAVVLLLAIVAFGGLVPDVFGPSVPDAPGEAESAQGLEFAAIEEAIVEGLSERRTAVGYPPIEYVEGDVARVATHHNRNLVTGEARLGDRSIADRLNEWQLDCEEPAFLEDYPVDGDPLDGAKDEAEVADRLLEGWITSEGQVVASGSKAGADVHLDLDGDLAVTVLFC